MRNRSVCVCSAVALLLSLTAILQCQAQTPSAPRPRQSAQSERIMQTAPVKARLWLIPEDAADPETAKRTFADVTLVGRTDSQLVLAADAALPGRLAIARVVAADFEIEYDRFEVMKASAKNEWSKVIGILSRVYSPLYPYLDIPENNAVEGVMELGTSMYKFARRSMRNAKSSDERSRSKAQFKAALTVFDACGKVDWSSAGMLASLKGCRCLLSIDTENAKLAARRVRGVDEPVPGDDIYGHYWLVRAELAQVAGDSMAAMDAAVKSLCFENKDVETFPDALLLSANCYETLGEPNRARDVYFEVAKLFPGTDWAEDALNRLEVIMAIGKTRKKEDVSAESSFFGLEEDMNALCNSLVNEWKNAKPVANDDVQETEVKDRAGNGD